VRWKDGADGLYLRFNEATAKIEDRKYIGICEGHMLMRIGLLDGTMMSN
jgi:hypothetical protein